jgi:hypothetical protein
MKIFTLCAATTLLLSANVVAEETNAWQVKSVEKQFEKKSGVFFKSSTANKTAGTTLTPSLLSKTGAATENKQTAQARTLTIRPEAKSVDHTFWIYDAWVDFYADEDRDGYFNHFSVEFDADTEFSNAQVYARLYLGTDEVFSEFHTTSTFNIFDDGSNDSFVVESELLSGFPSNNYEVLIELYDAYSDELVAVYDGNDDADLYLLPLESADYETTYTEPQVIVVNEHGGAMNIWTFLLIPMVVIGRWIKKPLYLKLS